MKDFIIFWLLIAISANVIVGGVIYFTGLWEYDLPASVGLMVLTELMLMVSCLKEWTDRFKKSEKNTFKGMH